MNKQELTQWIKEAKYFAHGFFEYDESGNKRETKIFQKDDKLYSIDFCNDHPSAIMDKKGYVTERDENGKRIRDKYGNYAYVYEPTPVKKVTRMMEVTEYVPEKE